MATIFETLADALKHHQGGRQSVAEQFYQQILDVAPNHFETLQRLGVTATQSGCYQAAIEFIGRAIQLNENVTIAHNNLGDAFLALRRIPEAIACFRRALELQPDCAILPIKLGDTLIAQGNLEEAIAVYRQGIAHQPERTEAYNRLANALLTTGRLHEADACCRKALELQPDDIEAHNQLGQVLQEMGNLDAALSWYRRGLQLNPQSALIHFNVARLFHVREQYSLALNHYQRATQLAPGFAQAHDGQGTIHYEIGELDQALAHYQEALRLRPDFAHTHCNTGIIHQERGEFDRAANSFREAIRLKPDCSEAFAHMASLLRSRLPDDDLVMIRHLAAKPNLQDSKRSELYFSLALVDDARCDYAAASEDLRLANSLRLAEHRRRGITYQSEQHDRFIAEMINVFTPSYFEHVKTLGVNSELPVFIIGLPRSGTTLTEQILACHSQVYSAGELGLGWSAFNDLREIAIRGLTKSTSIPNLDATLIEQIANNCLDRLAALNGTALRITDKLPDNYLFAGLIATLFPRAKIIHCRRDMRDTAISCWMADFRKVHWTNSFEDIASSFLAYERLMDHWHRTLPIPILNVDYEETVRDIERTAKRLVSWCGLDWEPACSAFHDHRRPVRTASVTQIRQAVYTSSVDRWKNYEPFLSPLFSLLPKKKAS